MKTLAAVIVETGKPLELVELEIPKLAPAQVLVELAFTSVCHTQILEARGYRGPDAFVPHCLGHEGSGTVREVGSAVTKVKPGDRVVVSWMKGTGGDVPGTKYLWNGKVVNAGGVTTFQKFAVVAENRLTPLPEGVPMEAASLLGCAVPTGMGAVMNTAKPASGRSLVVFGVGGVGLCAVAGAALSGCSPVVAVDVREDKLAAAKRMGATHTLLGGKDGPLAELKKLCPAGFDFAVESSGRPAAMCQALQCVRPRGGTAVVVGNARQGESIVLDPKELNLGKRLLGTWGGDNEPDRDFPRYGELVRSGRLDLSPLLASRYTLRDINRALDDLEAGRAVRPVVDVSAA